MTEEWRPVQVKGYKKLYEVSNTGRVRSISRIISRSRIHGATHKQETHKAHFTSKVMKPYYVSKEGLVKYHLHKRIKSGYRGQTDIYVYVEDLMRDSFPELYNNNDREVIRWKISRNSTESTYH